VERRDICALEKGNIEVVYGSQVKAENEDGEVEVRCMTNMKDLER
jgi:hypothetical protein